MTLHIMRGGTKVTRSSGSSGARKKARAVIGTILEEEDWSQRQGKEDTKTKRMRNEMRGRESKKKKKTSNIARSSAERPTKKTWSCWLGAPCPGGGESNRTKNSEAPDRQEQSQVSINRVKGGRWGGREEGVHGNTFKALNRHVFALRSRFADPDWMQPIALVLRAKAKVSQTTTTALSPCTSGRNEDRENTGKREKERERARTVKGMTMARRSYLVSFRSGKQNWRSSLGSRYRILLTKHLTRRTS